MNARAQLDAITREFLALKDQLRNIIDAAHGPSEGAWKESILRAILRRHLPLDISMQTGFVASKAGLSTQIDLLFCDNSRPAIFRDGDFSVVTPEAVLGIVEVKSTFRSDRFEDDVSRIAKNIEQIRNDGKRHQSEGKIFAALFYYSLSGGIDTKRILQVIQTQCNPANRKIDFFSIGPKQFGRYWSYNPLDHSAEYNSWHSYELPDNSFGYFVMNVIECLAKLSISGNDEWWYPYEGKEPYKTANAKGLFKGNVL